MLRTDFGCVGSRPSRARVRSHSHSARDGLGDDKTVITMNLSADISRRRYSDSEDKSSRPRILQGTLLLELDRKLKLPSGLLLNH